MARRTPPCSRACSTPRPRPAPAEAHGQGTASFPIFPQTAEQARALGGQHAVDGFEYYCTDRGQHPRSAKTFTWSSIDRMATFDAFRFVDLIARARSG